MANNAKETKQNSANESLNVWRQENDTPGKLHGFLGDIYVAN